MVAIEPRGGELTRLSFDEGGITIKKGLFDDAF